MGFHPGCGWEQSPRGPSHFLLSWATPSWHQVPKVLRPQARELPRFCFSALLPLPTPYSPSEILPSLCSKHIPTPTTFHPLSNFLAGPRRHCFWLGESDGFFPGPRFRLPVGRSDPFSHKLDRGASLLFHCHGSSGPHGSASRLQSPAGLAQPPTLLHPHPATEPHVRALGPTSGPWHVPSPLPRPLIPRSSLHRSRCVQTPRPP